MSMPLTVIELSQVAQSTGGYPLAAFEFVREGLGHTVETIHGETDDYASSHHVSGQQLCLGLRDHAINKFGMLAPAVLDSWNIHRTDDFGRIVFAMIDHGLMSKASQDTVDDFCGVYDFAEAFNPCQLAMHIGN